METIIPLLPKNNRSQRFVLRSWAILVLLTAPFLLQAAERNPALRARERKPLPTAEAPTQSVETLATQVRPTLVSITQLGKNGQEESIGSGFAISSNGLVATSLHVIGETHRIGVQFADGKKVEVTGIHAWDRRLDLAVIKIDTTNLPFLNLGDSDALKQGTEVVAMGNPLGLKYSVVQGVVSARREIDGVEMIQLAIPIESGNSGGPTIDLQGKVQGILALKHTLSPNLGFAVPVNALKMLLAKPNPVSMDRWLAIGTLDPSEWSPLWGAHWRRKTGRIEVEGLGSGFGGRSVCYYHQPAPEGDFELSVKVRLDDESGAAGLIFGGDGDQKHYGFYPSAGQLRLTRFDGPSVYSWTILDQVATPHYQPGEWNTLRVQHHQGELKCFVNDQLVITAKNADFAGQQVGLAKFRETSAAFKQFRLGSELSVPGPSLAGLEDRLKSDIERYLEHPNPSLLTNFQSQTEISRTLLNERARKLDTQAQQLRQLSAALHRRAFETELIQATEKPEDQISLFHSALLIAKLDNPDVDVEAYESQLEEMAREIRSKLPADASREAKLNRLKDYLFTENGFHGCPGENYYRFSNSYMNEVMDDRVGLPISMSVLFIELAGRIGLDGVHGIPLPGHFVVGFKPDKGAEQFLDVFNNAKRLSREDAAELAGISTESLPEDYLKPASKRDIIVRMLHNLLRVAEDQDSAPNALSYLNTILALGPDNPSDRLKRAGLRFRIGDRTGAKADLKQVLDAHPAGFDLEKISEFYESL